MDTNVHPGLLILPIGSDVIRITERIMSTILNRDTNDSPRSGWKAAKYTWRVHR
jgi:hypothetical protein